MRSTFFSILSVALVTALIGCGKKKVTQEPVQTDPCVDNPSTCAQYPTEQPPVSAPTAPSGCHVVVSPNPSRAGDTVWVNVFSLDWQPMSLMGWGTSPEANPRWGTLYNNTTGTMIYPRPGSFAVSATAKDAAGNYTTCGGTQNVQ